MIYKEIEEQEASKEFYAVLRGIDGKDRLETGDLLRLADSLIRYMLCPGNSPDTKNEMFKEYERAMRKAHY